MLHVRTRDSAAPEPGKGSPDRFSPAYARITSTLPTCLSSDARTMKRDEPLDLVRRLYDAWNAGDVAGAARLLSPEVRWENFGGAGAVTGREGLQTTLAGGSSGGTWQMSPMAVEHPEPGPRPQESEVPTGKAKVG